MRKFRLSLAIVLLFTTDLIAQKVQKSTDLNLAAPIYWGNLSPVRMFKDSLRQVVFSLKTSWIPGEEHKGMFRYIVSATQAKMSLKQQADDPLADTPANTDKFLRRVNSCDIDLELYDPDGFVVRRIPLQFSFLTSSEEVQVIGLRANGSSQMDKTEYLQMVGYTKGSAAGWIEITGSFNITWGNVCP
jgi:hypothetical protein